METKFAPLYVFESVSVWTVNLRYNGSRFSCCIYQILTVAPFIRPTRQHFSHVFIFIFFCETTNYSPFVLIRTTPWVFSCCYPSAMNFYALRWYSLFWWVVMGAMMPLSFASPGYKTGSQFLTQSLMKTTQLLLQQHKPWIQIKEITL